MQPKEQAAGASSNAGIEAPRVTVHGRLGARRFRTRRWLVAALLLLLVAPAAGLGYLSAQRLERDVVSRFGSAQAHLERARSLVAQANGTQAPAALDAARKEFERARNDFRAARAGVDGSPARLLPPGTPLAGGFVARRIAAVDHLGAMGMALCDAGLLSVDFDAQFLRPAAPGQPAGTVRLLGILTSAQSIVPALHRDLDRALAEVAAVDPAVLPASQRAALQRARDDVAKGIAGVAELDRIIPAIRDILAVDGKRTYVVEQVNPFELRAGGGYIGTYSLLVADHGSLSVLRSGDTHDLPDFSIYSGQPGFVAPPAAMTRLLQRKSWSFEDTNFYPDFRDNARAAAGFAGRDFGTGVDGVISIDLYAVAALLGVTGPIAVPGYDVTLTKDNAIATIMARDLVEDTTHKRVISSVAGPLMQRLVTLDTGQWLGLLQVLNQLATERHLQLFFTSDRAQPEMERLGLSGSLAVPGHDDFLSLGEANYGGNKANYFLTRRLDLELSRSGSTLHHVLTEDLTLDMSTAPRGYPGSYAFYSRLLVPATATGVRVTGETRVDQPSMTPPAGIAVVEGSGILSADPSTHGARLRIAYAWDTPWSQDATGAHRIYWQKQPGVDRDAVTVTWSAGGAPSSAKSDLATDRLLTLGGSAVEIAQGNAAQVSLPRL